MSRGLNLANLGINAEAEAEGLAHLFHSRRRVLFDLRHTPRLRGRRRFGQAPAHLGEFRRNLILYGLVLEDLKRQHRSGFLAHLALRHSWLGLSDTPSLRRCQRTLRAQQIKLSTGRGAPERL